MTVMLGFFVVVELPCSRKVGIWRRSEAEEAEPAAPVNLGRRNVRSRRAASRPHWASRSLVIMRWWNTAPGYYYAISR